MGTGAGFKRKPLNKQWAFGGGVKQKYKSSSLTMVQTLGLTQAEKMHTLMVWLATLALTLPSLSLCSPLFTMSAPNLLRVGSKEKIFVEALEYRGPSIDVEIVVKDFPGKLLQLTSKTVNLNAINSFQAMGEITIPEDAFKKELGPKQYVYLQAKFPQHELEKVVLLSHQSGYIFVQTDKTIYTPTSTVLYRVFALSPGLQPLEGGVSVEMMTPDGIIINKEVVFPAKGIHSGTFKLPEIVSVGTWKVVSKFKNIPQLNFTADFEVKEYVLPSFEVKLIPKKTFFYVDDDELSIDITARYLFGKVVEGKAYVLFGVIKDGERIVFPSSLQRVEVVSGQGRATLLKEHILKTIPKMHDLLGFPIYASVSVLTNSGTEIVEAETTGILVVTSPYTIHFHKTSKYFKPGMPLDVTVYVTNPDESPAADISLKLMPGSVNSKTQKNGMAKLKVNTGANINSLKITVVTEDPALTPDRQARKEMDATSYKTYKNSKNYLHIGIQATELEIGAVLQVNLNLLNNPGVQDLTYLVVSKGRIVHANRQQWLKGNVLMTLPLVVTKEMVPSFRFVAYYHLGSEEVVSDSVWVDVKDTCMGKLRIIPTPNKKNANEPRKAFSFTLEGDPGAKVGLVAVDKAVYVLNNKNRLTQKKIWDTVEKYDIGCTAGGGGDSMNVFYDAGLLFESSARVGTKPRTDPSCPAATKRRRRRSLTIMDFKASKVSNYATPLLKQCCSDGMVERRGYSCKQRAQYIIDGEECIEAFLHCCLEISKQKDEDKVQLKLARSSDEDNYISDKDIVSRTQFPESWLWNEDSLPNCPPGNPDCSSTTKEVKGFLKDSITTWEVTAISLSQTHGICVADPFEMMVTKSFFIDLKLPYSAVRNEQLEIKAVLYNNLEDNIKVRVELMETADVCSAASKKKKYRTDVEIEPVSSISVPFIIIPMALGQHSIEIKAAVYDSVLNDGIKKDLRVVAEGVQTRKEKKTIVLDPSKHAGQQIEHFGGLNPRHRMPNTPAETFISVTGELITQTIQAAISGTPLGHLIHQPAGCGEQNMISMTGPLIATHYLDKTNQWEDLGLEKRDIAIKHITTGYTQQLAFRKPDGSYGAWINHKSSTWLTAYVAKVFSMAYRLISIEEEVVCSAVKWLILNSQQPDGIFKEEGPVIHGEMVGNVRGADADASMTAFVLIAMQESRQICVERVKSLPDSIKKASDFLSRRIQSLTNPYAVAMTTYALANQGNMQLDTLFKFASGDKSHWPVAGGHYFTLEATAYALLALVKAGQFDKAGPVTEWLTVQRFYGGGHGSTQATIIVFQAVAQYKMEAAELKNTNLQVNINVAGRSSDIAWTFTNDNAYLQRSAKTQVNQNFTITAKGTGQGTVSIMTLYHALPAESEKGCKNFELEVSLKKDKYFEDPIYGVLETYLLTIDIMYLSTERDATMSILDVTLLTGFTVNREDLEKLKTGKDRYLQKYEMDKNLSEKGSLILYVNKVSHKNSDRLVFRIHEMQKVGMLQPAAVTVYEYYSMDKRCTKFYHPEKKDGALNRICLGDVCRCAEEECSLQKKQDEEVDLFTEACKPGVDYVYKAKVVRAELTSTLDWFTMLIEEVVKEGTETGVKGKERVFMAHPYCRTAIGFFEGKSYLLMGKTDDLIMSEDNSFKYMLGENTWIEYWPTEMECQTKDFERVCLGIKESTTDLLTFGCPT